MANTYVKIASVTVGAGGAVSMDFNSIPGTYDDLVLRVSVREESTNNFEFGCQINGSTSAIYNYVFISGNGSAASSDIRSNQTSNNTFILSSSNSTASTFGNAELYFPNYAGSTNKSMSADTVGENNGTTAYARLVAHLFASTSPITSLSIRLGSGDLAEYSTGTLYGIKRT